MGAQRKRGGGAFGGKKFAETNQKREPGTFKNFSPSATAAKLATKTSSAGFKEGGAIGGAASAPSLAKRARGGRTGSPFSSVHTPTSREGSSQSGHEGE